MPHIPKLQLCTALDLLFWAPGQGVRGAGGGQSEAYTAVRVPRALHAATSAQISTMPTMQGGMLHMQGTFFLLEKLKLTVLRRLLMRCCILHLEASAADTNPHHFPLGKLLVR